MLVADSREELGWIAVPKLAGPAGGRGLRLPPATGPPLATEISGVSSLGRCSHADLSHGHPTTGAPAATRIAESSWLIATRGPPVPTVSTTVAAPRCASLVSASAVAVYGARTHHEGCSVGYSARPLGSRAGRLCTLIARRRNWLTCANVPAEGRLRGPRGGSHGDASGPPRKAVRHSVMSPKSDGLLFSAELGCSVAARPFGRGFCASGSGGRRDRARALLHRRDPDPRGLTRTARRWGELADIGFARSIEPTMCGPTQ